MKFTGSRPLLSVLSLALAVSCDKAQVSSPGNSGGSGTGGAAAPGSGGPGGSAGGSFVLPDAAAGTGGGVDASPSNQRCAEEAHRAEIVPLDP
jgi:hypothetical protein